MTAWPASTTVPTTVAASTSCAWPRTAANRNTNPASNAAKALRFDTSLLLEFAVAGSLQETGGMAEFRLPTRWVRFVPYCSAYPPSRWGIVEKLCPEIKNPPATEATGGGSWAFALITRLLHSVRPRRHTRAADTARTSQLALLCVRNHLHLFKRTLL